MAKRIAPIEAWCAVGQDGLLDIDMVRRTAVSAQWAAGNVQAVAWPALAKRGWRVVKVRVAVLGDGDEDMAAPVVTPRPPGRADVGVVVGSRGRPISAAEAGKMRLLRLGEVV